MKKVWKRALACILVLALVAGYLPAKMNSVVNAEDSNAQQETALEFGKTDTYLQLSNPLSAAPQAIEATVNMPEIEKEWVLCAAEDIAFEKGTAADFVQTTDGTETVEPVAGTNYAQVQLTKEQEFLFSKKFDVTIPYTYSNDDVALSFWMYSDTAVTIDAGFIELTSSGTNDHNERCWGFSSNYSGNLALKTGWNYVELPVSKMIKGCTDADFNLQEANYIRWHSTKFSSITDDSTITIGLTDMKLVVIEEENYGKYADGEWTIVDVDGTIPIEAIGQGSASKPEAGSNALEVMLAANKVCINKNFVSSMTIPSKYKLTGMTDGKMSGDDADNLYIDFWVYATQTTLKAWLRLFDGTNNDGILRYPLGDVSMQQGWNHVQIPLKDFTYVTTNEERTDFSGLNSLSVAGYGSATEGTYYFSNFKIIDTDILETFATTIVSASDFSSPIQQTEVSDGVINYAEKTAAENNGKYRVDLTKTFTTIDLSAYQLKDLALEFWMKSNVDKTIAIDGSSNFLRLGTGVYGDNWGNTSQHLDFKANTISLTANEWTQVTLSLADAVNAGNLTSSAEFTWLRFLMMDLGEGTVISLSDIKIVEIEKEETSDITIISASDLGSTVHQTEVLDGTINYAEKTATLSGTKYRVDIQKTTIAAGLSAHQLENLALEFWMKSNVDKTIAINDSSTYLRLGTGALGDNWGTTSQHLNFKGNSISLIADEWTKVTLPLADAVNAGNLTSSAEFTWLRFLMMDLGEGTKISISDMKLVDWSASVTESTYDATNLNYMIFSNLNAESETSPIALMVTKEGNPAFVWGNTQYTLNQSICTGTDVNLKVVRNSSGHIVFYIDDVMVGMNLSKTSLLETPTTAHCIGGDAAGGQIFNGSISNLKVYSDATLSTCVGNWALSGNIQNVTGTMSDSSTYANTAMFRGSRADDWSDYNVPEEILGDKTIISCDDKTDLRAGSGNTFSITTEKGEVKDGTGACKTEGNGANTNLFIATLSNGVNISEQQEGEICFWMYIQEGTTFGETLTLEIGSGGNFDTNEYQWSIQSSELKTGEWNQVYRKFEKASVTGGEPNMEAINWVRFYSSEKLNGTVIIDDIKAVMPEQSWSLVYIPDMENLTSSVDYNETWTAMAQWIVDNAETENIQHVIGGGDTTTNNSLEAYARAMEGYQLFMNDVSWSTMVGLNDYADYTNRDATDYQTTFGEAVIKASEAGETYMGSYEDTENKSTTENSYYRFHVNGVKWMILQLEYAPREAVLTWADGILKEYPLDNVILTTQGYLDGYGKKLSMGTTTWNALSDNQNIKMILCGHSTNRTGAIVQATEQYSDETGSVPVLMMNAQDLDAGNDAYYTDRPLGMISILRFSADGTKVAVQYYSPTEGKSFSPDDNYGNANSNNILLSVDTEVCTPVVKQYTSGFEAAKSPATQDIPTGYIFAGWFTDEACKSALKKGNSVSTAYAKFVDAEVLSVKSQVKLDKVTDDEGNVIGYKLPDDMTDIRFVTTVDSRQYRKVGFEITAKHANGTDVTHPVGSEDVYGALYAVGMAGTEGAEPMPYSPADICSPQSTLFKTFTIKEIKKARYGETFTIRAYWITQDGTTVYGDTTVKTVEAGEP